VQAYGLLGLIMDAYHLNASYQVSGGPTWMDSDSERFDIVAKNGPKLQESAPDKEYSSLGRPGPPSIQQNRTCRTL
jgi:uncharacterized protein (TIGR03435 family)